MSAMTALGTLRRRSARKLHRTAKVTGQWFRVIANGARPETEVVFVVGSQRSGTRLPLEVMDYSPDISVYNEGTSPYFDNVMLQPLDYVAALVRRSPARIVVLKPICETHRVAELLSRFPGSKAIWIFRNFQGASRSAAVKWTSGRDSVRHLAERDFKAAAWRTGGLSEEKLETVRRLYRADMSLYEAEAVMWYLRNGLFFDLRMERRSDVLLVRYEDLVSDPVRRFQDMFRFIGSPMPARSVAAIKESSDGNRTYPELDPRIRALCEDLHDRLLGHYKTQVARTPVHADAAAETLRAVGTQ
jgi:hypothetical protein